MMRIANLSKSPLIGIVAATLLLFGGAAVAQQQGGGGQAQEELQQIQQRLAQAQDQAFENNPQLQAQADELEEKFIKVMSDAGYDPEAGLARLQEIQAEMQDETVSDERRQTLMEEAQQIQGELQEGQQIAMQEQSIIDAQAEFESDLMDAMRAEEPQTDELIARFEQMQQQMQQEMMQQMQ